jgi:hypothetical protein
MLRQEVREFAPGFGTTWPDCHVSVNLALVV